jgi:hypothetical protein
LCKQPLSRSFSYDHHIRPEAYRILIRGDNWLVLLRVSMFFLSQNYVGIQLRLYQINTHRDIQREESTNDCPTLLSQHIRCVYLLRPHCAACSCGQRSIPPFFPPSLLCEYRILALLVGLVEDSIEDFKFVTVRLREEKVDLWDVNFTSGGFLTQDIWLTRGTKLILKQKKTK